MPHPVVMSEVALEHQRSFQDVRRSRDDIEAGVQLGLQLVVVARRAGGVELLELTYGQTKSLPASSASWALMAASASTSTRWESRSR